MKRFKKLALSILGVTVLSLGLYACSNDGDDLNTSNSQEKIETKAKFSTEYI